MANSETGDIPASGLPNGNVDGIFLSAEKFMPEWQGPTVKRVEGNPALGRLNGQKVTKRSKPAGKGGEKGENDDGPERLRGQGGSPGLKARPTVKRVNGRHIRGMYTGTHTGRHTGRHIARYTPQGGYKEVLTRVYTTQCIKEE